jgi:hypothetical protein
MAGVHQGPKGAPAPLRGGAPQTYFDRRVHRREGPDTRAAVLPPELGFIAAGHGVSPQHLLAALETAPLGVRPLDAVLKEGILPEDVYYRALAANIIAATSPSARGSTPSRACRPALPPFTEGAEAPAP